MYTKLSESQTLILRLPNKVMDQILTPGKELITFVRNCGKKQVKFNLTAVWIFGYLI